MRMHHIEASPTAIAGIQMVVARSAHRFGRHTHDQFGLGLIECGAQTSASGRGPVEAMAGDVITVNPGEVHDGLPIDDRGRVWRMVYLDPSAMQALTGSLDEFAFPARRDARLAADFRRFFRAVRDPFCSLAAESGLLVLRTALGDRPAPRLRPANVQRAVQVLQDDPTQPIRLADLAGIAGLSRFHFLRSFAHATGLTPHAFQVQARLHLARRLILAGQTLAGVAAEAGFADQSHLTRHFLRSFGMTPGKYARNFVQDRGRGFGG